MKRIILPLALLAILLPARVSAQRIDMPEAVGVLKVKYEMSTYDGSGMFGVRNSRMGFKGRIGDRVRYSVLAEIGSQGSIGLLDSYVGYSAGPFEIVLGQQPYYLSQEVTRGASMNYFANRSFVGKFLTRYFESDPVACADTRIRDLSARDMGAMLTYSGRVGVPFKLSVGLFNGSGMTLPQWRKGVNVASRVDIGSSHGFGGSVGYYGGRTTFKDRIDMWAAGVRYHDERLHVEAEAGQRFQDSAGGKDDTFVGVVYGLYRFPLSCTYLEDIAPLLRYDYGDNIRYAVSGCDMGAYSGQRLTAGLTLGLSRSVLQAEIRINYEHYIPRQTPVDYRENPLFQNKVVLEFFAAF